MRVVVSTALIGASSCTQLSHHAGAQWGGGIPCCPKRSADPPREVTPSAHLSRSARLKCLVCPLCCPSSPIFFKLLAHPTHASANPLSLALASISISIDLEAAGSLSNKHRPGFATHRGSQPSGQNPQDLKHHRTFLLLILFNPTIHLWKQVPP